MKLTGKQKAKLRKLAQSIKPVVQIGNQEVHSKILITIDEAFNTKELIKVKIHRADKTDHKLTKKIATFIGENLKGVEVVGVIGTTVILFKRNKNPEKWIDLS